jgi:hypothetical protein
MSKVRFVNYDWAIFDNSIFHKERDFDSPVKVRVYTEAEHEEVEKLRAFYRVVNEQVWEEKTRIKLDALLVLIDDGTYNPKIGGENETT